MTKHSAMAAAIAMAMMSMSVTLIAAEEARPKSEPIYGYRMMDDTERNAYRERMRNAKSADERQAIRDEHHQAMEARAKERGVTLPQPRGPRGAGGGPGYGPGPRGEGMGMGYGPGGKGAGPRGEGKGMGYGPGGRGAGPRGECPAGQECPGPGYPGKGPGGKGTGPGAGKGPGAGQ
ncbi:MAG: hypothetical protein IT529_05010 [Burkholderiales bacterium]|nr:hypothetical protein [Burkholderiales bacterium]